MMKNSLAKLFILVIVTLNLVIIPLNNDAMAIFDPGSLTTQIPNTVNSVTNKVTSFTNNIVKKTLQLYKSAKDFFKGLFSRKNTQLPGTKKIEESKVVDITSEEEIRNIYPELFFRYPSKDINVRNAYKEERQEFYEDTIIEAFTAARQMEKKLLEMDMEIVRLEEDYTKAEDLNQGLYNRYMIDQTTDQYLAMLQELVALKAQMQSAYYTRFEIEPTYNPTKED